MLQSCARTRTRHCFHDEAADVRQAGVGSARAARLDRRRVGAQANDARALVRLLKWDEKDLKQIGRLRYFVFIVCNSPFIDPIYYKIYY